jgi:hypothetical protein
VCTEQTAKTSNEFERYLLCYSLCLNKWCFEPCRLFSHSLVKTTDIWTGGFLWMVAIKEKCWSVGRKAHQLLSMLCDTSVVTFAWKFGCNFVLTNIIRSYWHGVVIGGAMDVWNTAASNATFKGYDKHFEGKETLKCWPSLCWCSSMAVLSINACNNFKVPFLFTLVPLLKTWHSISWFRISVLEFCKRVRFNFIIIYCKQNLCNADQMKVAVRYVVCKNNQLTENTEMNMKRELASWKLRDKIRRER